MRQRNQKTQPNKTAPGAGALAKAAATAAATAALSLMVWGLALAAPTANPASAQANHHFVPEVVITVGPSDTDRDGRHDFAGTTFDVSFEVAPNFIFTDCTKRSDSGAATTSKYIIADDGSVGRVPGSPHARLKSQPSTGIGPCEYSPIFPATRAFGNLYFTGSTQRVSANRPTVNAQYNVVELFTPTASITVPDVDTNGDGNHDRYGYPLAIALTATDGRVSGCTREVLMTFRILEDGSLESTSRTIRLVDRPPDNLGFTCQYNVEYSWGRHTGWIERPGSTTVISGSRPNITVVFSGPAASTFEPEVTISVPQVDRNNNGGNDYQGRVFRVAFSSLAGSAAGCTPMANAVYTIMNNGRSTARVRVSLVGRPEGASSDCIYEVDWPETVAATDLQLADGATEQVSISSPRVSASYVGDVAPEPEIEVADEPETGPEVEPAGEPEAGPEAGDETPEVETEPEAGPEADDDGPEPEVGVADGGSGTGAGANPGVNSNSDTDTGSVGSTTASNPNSPVAVPDVAVADIAAGFSLMVFNGTTGTAPSAIASILDNAITMIWVFDEEAQAWTGWTSANGLVNLDSGLANGDEMMVYAPQAATVFYSPANLLTHPANVNSWTVPPRATSLHVYGGEVSVELEVMFAPHTGATFLLYLWDVATQSWKYHLTDRGPAESISIPWFDSLNPGDGVFIYSTATTPVTIDWPE